MRSAIGLGVVLLAASSGLMFLLLHEPVPPLQERPPSVRELEAGSAVHRSAMAGEVHRYELSLAKGQFLALDAEQQGTDVALKLFGPGGDLLLAVDSPNGERGTERLQLVSGKAGLHVLEIAAAGPSGTYALRITGLRPASPADLRLAAVSRAYFQAENLRRRGSDSLPAALAAYRHALALAEATRDLRWQAFALRRIGQVTESLDRRAEALAAYEASLGFYLQDHDKWEQALLFHRIGRLHYDAGDHTEAEGAYQQALVRFAALEDARQASALNDLGLVRAERGEMQAAIDSYEQALEVWRRTGEARFEATTLKNLGDVYASMRDNERAARLFRQALALLRADGDEPEEALVLESLGTVQRRAGAHQEALASLDRALALMRRHGDRHGQAIVLNSQGATHFQLGSLDRARRLYQEARALAREIEEPGTEAYARINLGWLDETQGRLESAYGHHRAALATLRDLNDFRGEASALFGLARTERKRGRLAEARSWAEAALARIELLRSGVDSDEVQWEFLADRHSYYELLVDILMQMGEARPGEGFAARALQVSEQGRARALLDLLRNGRVDLAQRVDPDLLARERELAAKLQAIELERLRRELGSAAAGLDAALSTMSGELHDLRGRIRAQNPSYAALALAEIPSLREIQEQLDPETLLLEISLGEERSFLWLVGRRSLVHRTLPRRKDLEAQARRAGRLLEQSQVPVQRRQLDLVLEDLSRTLLGPVAGQLGSRRLVVVADGALQLIPFAALPLPSAAGAPQPLVARHEIVHLPSIAVLQVLRDREASRTAAGKTLAVFGDPVFHLDGPRTPVRQSRLVEQQAAETGFSSTWFRSLPSSRRESEAILALVPPPQRFGALGFEANLDRVLSSDLQRFRILHFATHGLLNHEHPDLSGIALSRFRADGTGREAILWAHQIYDLDLPMELVVLSACQTALGKEVRGEGVIGLTRGFMHAGATRVLVSLWNVSDMATAELMTRFYQAHLRQGLPASAALRQAQLSLLAEDRWSSPYCWAGFILQGDWT